MAAARKTSIVDVEKTNVRKMLSTKDILIESFLQEIIDNLPDADGSNSAAVELARVWKEEARKKISSMSVTLAHRVEPIVQLMLEQKLAANMEQSFASIKTIDTSMIEMIEKYQKCFNIWVDASDCVSFKTTNKRLLGQISPKDMYILTFFSFLTCKRSKNDNILQLGMVGCSTCGKSTLFEACLMEGSHVTTNEVGVGRFQVGNKPILMFHDINIRTLATSKDTEKIKTIARTEPTVTKIHSTVYTLQPLFLFYSSNERLMSHKFSGPSDRPYLSQFYFSQVNEVGKKRLSEDSLLAVQNRFIEAFVRSPPPLKPNDLPSSGGFQRIHAVLGLFERILTILAQYSPSDFHSPVLSQYVLQGLCLFNARHTQYLKSDKKLILESLIDKYIQPQLKESLNKYL